jgi:hypothetical protein
MEKNLAINASISPAAHEKLYRFAREFSERGGRLPLGKVLSAMILYFDEMSDWQDIADDIRSEIDRESDERRKRDRERKRNNIPPSGS